MPNGIAKINTHQSFVLTVIDVDLNGATIHIIDAHHYGASQSFSSLKYPHCLYFVSWRSYVVSLLQVSEKRWYWLKVFALATIRDWDALEKFSKEKRPPIGEPLN